jgi:hypothetical protein
LTLFARAIIENRFFSDIFEERCSMDGV